MSKRMRVVVVVIAVLAAVGAWSTGRDGLGSWQLPAWSGFAAGVLAAVAVLAVLGLRDDDGRY